MMPTASEMTRKTSRYSSSPLVEVMVIVMAPLVSLVNNDVNHTACITTNDRRECPTALASGSANVAQEAGPVRLL